ncbi:DUF443 family protein [Lentibacillus sp. CBA3610]|uniref:DUF443 family protein n=1 Tax=Lentibacillus sp. CBA3610 TaxID=2518176 RepID=UPI001599BCD0|nr:DUF443 family protein [Lentibacillus sp. CBA3610]QKY69794.1 DUF443 family protein [Lentibacillus sp. CBA3610]
MKRVLKTKKINRNCWILVGGVYIANLRPLTDYFDIQSPTFTNLIVVMIAVILIFSLRFYINHLNKKNLYEVINLEQLASYQLWIRPESTKHFFLVLSNFLIFLVFSVLGFVAFIELPNVLILFFSMLILLFVTFINFMTVKEGNTTVKFKGDKEAS